MPMPLGTANIGLPLALLRTSATASTRAGDETGYSFTCGSAENPDRCHPSPAETHCGRNHPGWKCAGGGILTPRFDVKLRLRSAQPEIKAEPPAPANAGAGETAEPNARRN